MKKVKYFFWRLSHPISLLAKTLERTWYFEVEKKVYRVIFTIQESQMSKKTTKDWEVTTLGGQPVLDKDLENYLIEKAKEDLQRDKG